MFILLIKIVLIVSFGIILFQDMKERQVYWFLFPVVGLCLGVLFFSNTLPELFYVSVLLNLFFVSMLLGAVYIYTKLKLKRNFKEVIGLGDILLFFFFIFGCASISFTVLIPSALIFSLILHLLLSKRQKINTVPLAGYMSLFFGITFLGFWFGIIDTLYQF